MNTAPGRHLPVILSSLILSGLAACGAVPPQAACSSGFEPTDWRALSQQAQLARQRWESTRPGSYRFTFQPESWLPQPSVRIDVLGDSVAAARRLDDGTALTLEERQNYRTVDELLASIERTVRAHEGRSDCYHLSVQYDPARGYPVRYAFADYTPRLADAAGGYQLNEFEVLP